MSLSRPNAVDSGSHAANARTISVALAMRDAKLKERVLAGLDGEKFLVRDAKGDIKLGASIDVLITDQSLACAELVGFHERLIAGDVGVLLIGLNLTADVLLPRDFTRRELRLATRMLAQMITLRRQNRRLQQLACIDALTQLPNRRAIEDRFTHLAASHPQITLALLDIDQFKTVNSKLGYVQGDDALRSVGKVLAVRSAPHFAGRLGGDEFVVLLRLTDEQAAYETVEQLRHDVGLAAGLKTARPVSASAGFVIVSGKASFEQALAAADSALRSGKQAGGKRTEQASTKLI